MDFLGFAKDLLMGSFSSFFKRPFPKNISLKETGIGAVNFMSFPVRGFFKESS